MCMKKQKLTQDVEYPPQEKSSFILFQAYLYLMFFIFVAAILILFNSWQIWNTHQHILNSAKHASATTHLLTLNDAIKNQIDCNILALIKFNQTDELLQLLQCLQVVQVLVSNVSQLHIRFINNDSHDCWLASSLGKFTRNIRIANWKYLEIHQLFEANSKIISSCFNGSLLLKLVEIADWRSAAILNALSCVFLLAIGKVLTQKIKQIIQTHAELVNACEHLTTINMRLKKLAMCDYLTGLANRRQFDNTLNIEVAYALRHYRCTALLMLDIDCFKQYNDIYGHVAGDQCLQQIGHTLKCLVRRSNDIVARYGGEEFGIILFDTDAQGALCVAEGIINAVRELKIPHKGNPHGIVTISIGICAKVQDTIFNDMPISLVNLADHALYQAKKGGKNCIYISNCK